MDYTLVETNGKKYIECLPGTICLRNEQDALDFVAACGENDTYLLMLHSSNLNEDFFDLKTRVAGSILLKFTNYYIKAAAILTPELVNQGKFQDWVIETNRGKDFRVFYDRDKAEAWLTGD
jgi:PadR family transcriptional regulator, regulatory protein AphA